MMEDTARKLKIMASLAITRPSQFIDRMCAIVEGHTVGRPHDGGFYSPLQLAEALPKLEAELGLPLERFLSERALLDIEAEVKEHLSSGQVESGIPDIFDADPLVARLCYAFVRATAPRMAVETGVSHGVTSAYILKALAVNGGGHLTSIDLPPLSAACGDSVGRAVPKELRNKWTLLLGTSRSHLGAVARKSGGIDFFLHDSLHSYRTIAWELATVRKSLTKGAIVLADDIENNSAFREWSERKEVEFSLAIQQEQKGALFGISCMAGRQTG